jgi:hypothetical protein
VADHNLDAAQTLSGIAQSASLKAAISLTVSQTLSEVSQSGSLKAAISLSASQTLAGISQVFLFDHAQRMEASQSLATVTQVAAIDNKMSRRFDRFVARGNTDYRNFVVGSAVSREVLRLAARRRNGENV